MALFDDRQCALGEGPFWHPERQQFFWFDIIGKKLLSRVRDVALEWSFDEYVSAAGWVTPSVLLIASETKLFTFDVDTKVTKDVIALEADNPVTRSNDGRADPKGGFWIGTMGKAAEPGAGAIYRYYKGELHKLFPNITIPNSICFAPDGSKAYYCDTITSQIMVTALDDEGWPIGSSDVFVDLRQDGLNPDGSVTDAAGNLWNAQWGASRVAAYSPDGQLVQTVNFPARHTSCPAIGGPKMNTLYCTTAQEHLTPETIAKEPANGQTFWAAVEVKGWREPRVNL